MLPCADCGRSNRDEARFCDGCGSELAPPCASCGAGLRAGAKFCDACGVAVAAGGPAATAAPAAPAPAPATVEVRKTVSVVFMDLVGSTALQEAMDQETVRLVMGRYYDTMRSTVEAHGGTVEKFIGDAVCAVWGIPVVEEDDALRAVQAAAAMNAALQEINVDIESRWGVRLRTRTGV